MSLVSRSFVATAAHCIIRARLSEITVYLGELDTQDTGQVLELAPAEYHRVYRKIIHPDFQFRTTQPDRLVIPVRGDAWRVAWFNNHHLFVFDVMLVAR